MSIFEYDKRRGRTETAKKLSTRPVLKSWALRKGKRLAQKEGTIAH